MLRERGRGRERGKEGRLEGGKERERERGKERAKEGRKRRKGRERVLCYFSYAQAHCTAMADSAVCVHCYEHMYVSDYVKCECCNGLSTLHYIYRQRFDHCTRQSNT